VLAVQIVGAPAAEKYVASTDRWVSAGNTSGTLPLVSLNDPVTNTTVTINVTSGSVGKLRRHR